MCEKKIISGEQGDICINPNCGSDNTSYESWEYAGNGVATVEVHCDECGSQWVATFDLSGATEIEQEKVLHAKVECTEFDLLDAKPTRGEDCLQDLIGALEGISVKLSNAEVEGHSRDPIIWQSEGPIEHVNWRIDGKDNDELLELMRVRVVKALKARNVHHTGIRFVVADVVDGMPRLAVTTDYYSNQAEMKFDVELIYG